MAEKTPEQIEKEKAEAEKRAKMRDIALKNLDSSLWDYASPKLITSENYGKIAEASEGFYQEALSKAPDQNIYNQVFLPQLMSEGGAITSPYIQQTSYKILQESLFSVKVNDLTKNLGITNVREDLKDKYVSQLDEKSAGQIAGSYLQYKTQDKVKDILSMSQKGIVSGLEELLKPNEENKEGGNNQ
jgi:hypothetical protein